MSINKRTVIQKKETKNVGNKKKWAKQQMVAKSLVTVF